MPVVERWFHGCHTNRPITTTAMTMTAMMMGVLFPAVAVESRSIMVCKLSSEEGDVVLAYPAMRSAYQASMRALRFAQRGAMRIAPSNRTLSPLK